jgi:hypothetical protein
VAAAAFSAGWFVAPVKPLTGPLVAQAAGIALIAISVVPLTGRDLLRVGAGATLLVLGGSMLMQSWAGQPSSLYQISLTALLVGLVGATSLLISPLNGEAAALPEATAADAGEVAEVAAPAAPPAPAARRPGRKPKVAAVDVTAALPEETSRVAADDTPAPPEPIPGAPVPSRTRVTTIRNAATRSLRGGPPAARPGRPASGEPGMPPDGPDGPVPPPSRVRRLRPREPRQ